MSDRDCNRGVSAGGLWKELKYLGPRRKVTPLFNLSKPHHHHDFALSLNFTLYFSINCNEISPVMVTGVDLFFCAIFYSSLLAFSELRFPKAEVFSELSYALSRRNEKPHVRFQPDLGLPLLGDNSRVTQTIIDAYLLDTIPPLRCSWFSWFLCPTQWPPQRARYQTAGGAVPDRQDGPQAIVVQMETFMEIRSEETFA